MLCYQGKIPTVLKDNGLTTLVDLVTKAGLAGTLSGEGIYYYILLRKYNKKEIIFMMK